MKLCIRKYSLLKVLTFPNNSRLVFAGSRKMAIETIIGSIDLAANKPLSKRCLPLYDLSPLLEPCQFFCLLCEKFLGVFNGSAIHFLILRHRGNARLLRKFLAWLEEPFLGKNRFNRRGLAILRWLRCFI